MYEEKKESIHESSGAHSCHGIRCDCHSHRPGGVFFDNARRNQRQASAGIAKTMVDSPGEQEELMEAERIVITIGGREFPAALENTEAARAFAELLPLHLQLEELNGNEKYTYLDNPLPTDSRNPETIHAGDLMLFGSSCIVLFYQTFPTQYTYTPIAHLDDAQGLADCVGTGDVEAQIALA